MKPKGKCFIFSAPSGAGKTTIVKHLLQEFEDLKFSVSATTRQPRHFESHGLDYNFMGLTDFKRQIREGAFVEWEEVYPDQYYGTLKNEVQAIRDQGLHVIFDVDVVGGLSLKRHFGGQALAVFVAPPDLEALRSRLEKRKTDTPEKLEMRLAKANKEMVFASEFDHTLLNNRLEDTLVEAEAIVRDFLAK